MYLCESEQANAMASIEIGKKHANSTFYTNKHNAMTRFPLIPNRPYCEIYLSTISSLTLRKHLWGTLVR